MDVLPLTGVLGAELIGFDLRTADPEQLTQVQSAITEHQVVVIRAQDLSPGQQVAVSRWFGPFSPVPFIAGMPEHPEVIRVVKEASEPDAFNFGGAWHSDFSFLPQPPAYTLLHAVDVPTYGGDTGFACMYTAYEILDEAMQERLRGLTALHSASHAYSPDLQWLHDGLGHMSIVCDDSANDVIGHPLVIIHPDSGRTALYFNTTYVRGLVNNDGSALAESEVRSLLAQLHQLSTSFALTYRHRWLPGDLVMWDNRCTQHLAVNDYGGVRRELRRTTVAGPVPAAAT